MTLSWQTVGHTLGLTCMLQLLGALVSVPWQTDNYYDLMGSIGFVVATIFSFYNTPPDVPPLAPSVRWYERMEKALRPSPVVISKVSFSWRGHTLMGHHPRQLLTSLTTILWAIRLGSFLFLRILASGRDPRFDHIKKRPIAFLGAWFLQTVWISVTGLPVYLLNSLPASAHPRLNGHDAVGLVLWLSGLLFEVVAEYTKSKWRREKATGAHGEPFIQRGVWSWCRHPNYLGEIILWTGQAYLAFPTIWQLHGTWTSALVLMGPTFEYLLIRYVSGVSILEGNMDRKLADNEEYRRYKRSVPRFFPTFRKLKSARDKEP